MRCNDWENLSLGFWESMRDLRRRGGVRGRGLVGSDCGDSQCKGTRTHVRHR